ncbi:MAG: serine hydrolase [Gemmatimonadaceae bacterium]|nr:serine hydrolase [Gemmatimonadaceae bacterium]
MRPHLLAALAPIALASSIVSAQAPAQTSSSFPPDSTIRTRLAQRVDNGHAASIVIGMLDHGKERYVSYGRSNFGETPLVDPDAIYEIGSITKVVTNIVLADMVLKGEVAIDDPVSKYLPSTVTVPSRNGKVITLLDLATASSGLPSMPLNFRPKDPANPFADYTVAQMYEFLSSYTLPRDPGQLYEYSNLGMGLLGHALALRAGTTYEQLMIERVLTPLGMQDTRITLTPDMARRFVVGHDADMEAVPAWDLPTLAGAGALRSSARDMMKFARAVTGALDGEGPLAKAIAMSIEPQRPTTSPGMRIGLAWHVREKNGERITWHNGGTGGFRTFFGVDNSSKNAVIVMTSGGVTSDELGFTLLDPSLPVRVVTARPTVNVPSATLQSYVGQYPLAPAFIINIALEGEKLFAKVTNQPRFRLWASSDHEFYLRAVPAKVIFQKDSTGAMTLTLDQNGAKQRATKQ